MSERRLNLWAPTGGFDAHKSLLPRMGRVTTEAEGFSLQEVARWRRAPDECPVG